ncbi:MAG: ABC transporter permease [Clostridiales bacterium]|nr:ABC transporter permease [Clostridiales bacterium]
MLNILLGAVALGLLWSMATLGVYMTYRVLDVADLTVEGSIVLGASVAAVIIQQGGNPLKATLAAMAAGMAAGLATGLLHTLLKIPSLLAGILSMIALYSINIRVMLGTSNIPLLRLRTVFSYLQGAGLSKNQSAMLTGGAFAGLAIAAVYWFLGTELGCALRATGNSPQMARAQGIDTDAGKLLGYVLANGLVGLSGGLIAQYLGFSDVQMGSGSIVIALASLIIGEVVFARSGGRLRALCAMVLGSVAYRLIIALVFEAGMPATDLKLFTALTVAAALYLPTAKQQVGQKLSQRKEAKQRAEHPRTLQDLGKGHNG